MPAARQASTCSLSALAVSPTIGMRAPPGISSRMRRVASRPSITGICTSISTRSTRAPAQHLERLAAVGREHDLAARALEEQLGDAPVGRVVLDQQHRAPAALVVLDDHVARDDRAQALRELERGVREHALHRGEQLRRGASAWTGAPRTRARAAPCGSTCRRWSCRARAAISAIPGDRADPPRELEPVDARHAVIGDHRLERLARLGRALQHGERLDRGRRRFDVVVRAGEQLADHAAVGVVVVDDEDAAAVRRRGRRRVVRRPRARRARAAR